jgi:hypothetical protein
MDRRQLLLGMTAVGLAGQFNLSELLQAQILDTNQSPKATIFYLAAQSRTPPSEGGPICSPLLRLHTRVQS